ncbi:MAG: hypothetical protein NC548_54495 [Lachnospiraceae bacterium]|nr:hypothetical protein [Lachnospiraceae bacterium]
MTRCYSELVLIKSFRERYEYLRLGGKVGEETFGFDRYLNQAFYKSLQWRRERDQVIARDNGCDLGVPGYEINGKIIIHHMNPVSVRDIREQSDTLLNPEYLICVTLDTHNAIHYGDESLLLVTPSTRSKNDTCPWRA